MIDWLIESGSLMAPLETTNFHQIEYKNLISMQHRLPLDTSLREAKHVPEKMEVMVAETQARMF